MHYLEPMWLAYLFFFLTLLIYSIYGERSLLMPEMRVNILFLLLAPWAARWNRPIRFPRAFFLIAVAALIWVFTQAYLGAGGFSSAGTRWSAWHDQLNYYNMLAKIRAGTFGSNDFTYGLGYPLLAALFAWTCPSDPYFPLNLLCYVAMVILGFRVLQQLKMPWGWSLLVCAWFAMNPFLPQVSVVPWSSTPSMVAAAVITLIVLKTELRWQHYLAFGISAGVLFASRYVDVMFALPAGLYLIAREIRLRRTRWMMQLAPGLIAFLVIVSSVFVAHKVYFGGFLRNPYQFHLRSESGLTEGDPSYYTNRFGIKAAANLYAQLIESKSVDPQYQDAKHLKHSLFMIAPLFLFFPAGLFLLYRDHPENRSSLLALIGGGILFLVIYGVHPGTLPGCLKFGSLHYFKPVSILFLIGSAYYFWRTFRAQRPIRLIGLGACNLAIYLFLNLFFSAAGIVAKLR